MSYRMRADDLREWTHTLDYHGSWNYHLHKEGCFIREEGCFKAVVMINNFYALAKWLAIKRNCGEDIGFVCDTPEEAWNIVYRWVEKFRAGS